jgi:hypothetical protein
MDHLLLLIPESLRMARKGMVRGLFGHKRYTGKAADICIQIIEDCWNGSCFMGSAGHFSQFWIRDLGMCVEPLLKLGHEARVSKSLEWALGMYEKNGRVTTTIFYDRVAIDIYDYGSDSVPFLIRALRLSGAQELAKAHRAFLQKEVNRFREVVFDESLGLVKPGKYFPGAKDCMKGSSTVYANTMMAMLSRELDLLGVLENPFKGIEFSSRIAGTFWKHDHFKDDIGDEDIISSDANVWPYWTGVIEDDEKLRASIATIVREKMDEPFPIKYTSRRYPEREELIPRLFTPNYQGNVAWTQVGPTSGSTRS